MPAPSLEHEPACLLPGATDRGGGGGGGWWWWSTGNSTVYRMAHHALVSLRDAAAVVNVCSVRPASTHEGKRNEWEYPSCRESARGHWWVASPLQPFRRGDDATHQRHLDGEACRALLLLTCARLTTSSHLPFFHTRFGMINRVCVNVRKVSKADIAAHVAVQNVAGCLIRRPRVHAATIALQPPPPKPCHHVHEQEQWVATGEGRR